MNHEEREKNSGYKVLPSIEAVKKLYEEARDECIFEAQSDAWLWERHFCIRVIEECVDSIQNEGLYVKDYNAIINSIKKRFGI